MKNLSMKSLNEIKFCLEIILGISDLLKISCSKIISKEDVEHFIFWNDWLAAEGYENVCYDWINGRIDKNFDYDNINNYKKLEDLIEPYMAKIKSYINNNGYI